MKKCPQCHTDLLDLAIFCYQCGRLLPAEEDTENLPDTEELEQEIIARFFAALKKRIEEEWHPGTFQIYSERLLESGFLEIVHRRTSELAEEFSRAGVAEVADMRTSLLFDELLDYFFIHYCRDINEVYLPEAILKYQKIDLEDLDLFQLVWDYLDLDREEEGYYTDFLQMPVQKLTNAGKFFLFPAKKERILLICDQSFFGSLKEGFALTEKALYWKAYLQTARKVFFTELKEVKKEKEWITINDHFFNVNTSINLKMMKLLKKLKGLFALR